MENLKHTPGPWTVGRKDFVVDANGTHGHILLNSSNWDEFISVARHSENEDDSTAEANARLIAAAPDLLEALQFITNVADGKASGKTKTIELRFERDTLLTWLGKAKEAITKATQS